MTTSHDDDGGLDLRRFSALSPLEQLEKLESDGLALKAREKAARSAEAELRASHGGGDRQ